MDFFEDDKEYIRELLERFENSQAGKGLHFFDSGELEDIIYYYINEGQITKAANAIEYALQNFPTEHSFQIFKAQYYLHNSEPEKALAILNNLQDVDSDNPDLYLTRANVYSSMRDYNQAIRQYKIALNLSQDDLDEIHTSIAFEYLNLRQYQRAIVHLKTAFKMNPSNTSLLYEIGHCYDQLGTLDDAIAFFDEIISKNPYSQVAWFNLGMAYTSAELYEKAIDAFDYAIAIEPGFIPAYYSKAQCFEQMEKFDQAIQVYKLTFEHEKPDAMIFFYIAECYTELEKYSTAIEYYRKSIGADRQFADSWMGIGICFAEMEDYAEAMSHMYQALKLEPDNTEYLRLIANNCLSLDLKLEAEAALKKATEIQSDQPEAWFELADLYALHFDDYPKALQTMDEGLFFQPDNVQMAYRRVVFLYRCGRTREAILELYIALSQDFSLHVSMFEYDSTLLFSDEIVEVIRSFKNQNE